MKTIEVKLFEFEELSAEVQAKVIKKFADINVHDDWHNDSLETFKEELSEVGFTDAEISYSGFWSQGDGLSFDANIDIDKFAETTNEKRIANLINNGELDNFEIKKTSFANHYSHEKTRYVDEPYLPSNKHKNLESILEAFKEKINDKRLELCRKYYQALETEFDSLKTEEAIKETIIENEYTFLENGERFDE